MEYVDIFDSNYNQVGSMEKDKAHLKCMWHQNFHCWIIRPDNKILFQLRSKDKPTFPALLDISAAGHIASGEKIEDGIREIEEELGFKADFNDLTYLGYFKEASDIETKKGLFMNREFCHVYFLKDATPINEYKIQEEELDGLYEADIYEAQEFFAGDKETLTIKGWQKGSENETRDVAVSDFVPYATNGLLKIMIMAERYLKGEKYLAV